MDEHEKAARESQNCTITDKTRMCPHFGCKRAASLIRKSVAKALHEANAAYQNCGVPSAHVAMIEVRNRAVGLQKMAERVL